MREPVAVLIIGFKRLNELRRVLDATQRHHVGKIYVFLDHAREGRPDEAAGCMAVRDWVSKSAAQSDRIYVRLAESNYGCVRAVPAGIDWAFSEGHSSLIVLEDDCLPAPSFFSYMQTMLERFADDDRVSLISGNQFLPASLLAGYPYSYWFSRFIHIWGWGTWQRAWKHYDHSLSMLDEPFIAANRESLFPGPAEKAFYSAVWDKQRSDPADTSWDSRWLLACLAQRGLCVCPTRNLVRNIGFGAGSTHTSRASTYHVVPLQHIEMPLRHPPHVIEWKLADRWWFDRMISKRIDSRVRRFLKRVDPDRIADEV